jgi:hypothetical protein
MGSDETTHNLAPEVVRACVAGQRVLFHTADRMGGAVGRRATPGTRDEELAGLVRGNPSRGQLKRPSPGVDSQPALPPGASETACGVSA